MKKNSKKKNTNNKLVNTAAKNKAAKPKKLVSGVVKGKNSAKNQKLTAVVATRKATANRNSFRRALYRANKMIKSGNSFYKNELSMKDFKKEYADFGKRTGMLKGKNLRKDLETFLANEISNRTPKQCGSAVDNLMEHLNDAVRALNESKDGIKSISDTNKKYIRVLTETGSLKTDEKDGKEVYSIIEEKIPTKEDLLTVNDKYLKFKRLIQEYFGDQEYDEAYGS